METELEKYRRSDVVLSSALHGCVIGVGMQKKVIAVSGDWKIEGFMEQMDRGDWVVGLHELHRIDSLLEEVFKPTLDSGVAEKATSGNEAIAEEVKRILSGLRPSVQSE